MKPLHWCKGEVCEVDVLMCRTNEILCFLPTGSPSLSALCGCGLLNKPETDPEAQTDSVRLALGNHPGPYYILRRSSTMYIRLFRAQPWPLFPSPLVCFLVKISNNHFLLTVVLQFISLPSAVCSPSQSPGFLPTIVEHSHFLRPLAATWPGTKPNLETDHG